MRSYIMDHKNPDLAEPKPNTEPENWPPERLRLWRTDAGLTVEQAARLIGVSQATLSRWENSVVPVPHWVPDVMLRVVAHLPRWGSADV